MRGEGWEGHSIRGYLHSLGAMFLSENPEEMVIKLRSERGEEVIIQERG